MRELIQYRSRISGPLMDRIDIHIEVPAVKYRELAEQSEGESSAVIAKRVEAARGIQLERFKGTKVHCNAHMNPRQIRKFCEPDAAGHRLLEMVTERLGFSARAYTRILKVARTIADLEYSESVREQHLAEAIQYRSLDRKTS
ncbi:Mg chelatase-related protein [Pelobacter propionicus DSM 2379]|uniref:Mg chelatase-related protein n=1 Tax=Pelobacter propionicus (strain DSM 2379 / NBRC 103807 / OttBd1) TaxID=338966 RepID=A1AKB8_PELPD|nr:Mg chelatase-related protein [Pelobacter propionicus DSM 2379]